MKSSLRKLSRVFYLILRRRINGKHSLRLDSPKFTIHRTELPRRGTV